MSLWVVFVAEERPLTLPLEGLTVLAIEQAVSAPFASRQLADLGARVIKIERPGVGDFARGYDETVKGLASHFVWVNRGKESVTLDLKRPEAIDIVRRLLSRSDVLIHNLVPGAMARLGLAASALRAEYPRLVICEVSGYGATGPYRDRKAYDLMVQSEAGLVSITGTPDVPSKVGISIADIAAGMYGFSSILAALLQRTRTGEGAILDISMLDSLAEWMGYATYFGGYGASAPPRTGARHAAIAPYGPFTAGDGEVVYLGLQNEREWARFCEEVLRQPGLVSDPRFRSNSSRVEHQEALEAIITASFAEFTASQVIHRLDAAGIANARMRSVADVIAHPQLNERQRWRDIESPAGPIRALVPPFNIEGAEPRMGGVPALGAHTDSVLREVGFAPDEIAHLRRIGVI